MMEMTKERGLLFGKGGPYGNTFRVLGPLCMSIESAKKTIGIFEECVKKL